MEGGGAAESTVVDVEAYVHDVGDYVNTAKRAGFGIARLGEWRDDGDPTAMPRLLTLELSR